ncbi:conserved protein of unknown function [Candidatus Promineifilum breve]|uniref:N-acetyltransferase domain-containing protein n=1 Tax=Candidatus Promineifilum breve TaxID=1806508 RepID=A0A160T5J5_9CHLR|nr:GNAT family N-acetyltransferase [Candidatus Promineifilum breve]CUS04115.2 conserved protein of unknown function [Candidatus Promineifilum breve]
MPYFNYEITAHPTDTAGYWARRDFVRAWWSIARDDDRWTPPEYDQLRRELNPRHNDHLARLAATLIYVAALQRTGVRRSRTDQQEIPLTSVLERPLAAAVAVVDPRRKGTTAHLALPHFSSDAGAFDRLYYYLVEQLSAQRYHRFVAPVGLSPHLGSGLLVDSWGDWPPLHTPGNPPYAPELLGRKLRPFQTGRLYQAPVSPPDDEPSGPARVGPFDPSRLTADLLPLLIAATANPVAAFPPPDALEAAFMLRHLPPGTSGWLAEIDGAPVGFVLLGPDTAGQLRAARGGRSLWGRAYLRGMARLPGWRRVTSGRLFFGAVVAERRGQGIGRQLWGQALRAAHESGWATLSIGPIWASGQPSPAAGFLERRAAVARQTYQLYEASF